MTAAIAVPSRESDTQANPSTGLLNRRLKGRTVRQWLLLLSLIAL